MNKKDIIKRFLKQGTLLSPGMLDKINEKNIDRFLKKRPEEPKTHTKIDVNIRGITKKQKLSTKDFVDYYNNKYNGIRNILMNKMKAVSVGNTKKSFSDVSVIGMVRELKSSGLVLEDPTGEIEVVLNNKKEINPDDVIGVKGFVRENKLFAKEVVFPDTPLTHPIGSLDAKIIITTNITEKTKELVKEIDLVLALNAEKTQSNIIKTNSNPGWITLSKNGDKVNLLVYKPENKTTIEQAVRFLIKRHLSPLKNRITGPEDPFLIEPIPDIFWLVSDEKGKKTYKGVTIISCGPNSAARIDLKTKEIEFI
ncbi:MAG: hypothetical protein JSW41_04145 [Candidatus Aenigmatarchaeota archaeon]|nr:MAG: hypothetical protein JSW41_04145 [Candidatus Aenigmarchaeota archaeon]